MLCVQGKSMSVRLSGTTGKPSTIEAGLPRELALSQLPPSQTTFPANLALTIISIGVRGETHMCSCLQAVMVDWPSL